MRWELMAAAALAAGWTMPAQAGVYSNDLGKCMVAKTSDADKAVLIRWIFISISSTPAIKDLVRINDEQRTDNSKAVASLLVRLLSVDCRKETVLGLKYDGSSAIDTSFAILGEASMSSLMTGPDVMAGLIAPTKYIDNKALEGVYREAGMKPPSSDT